MVLSAAVRAALAGYRVAIGYARVREGFRMPARRERSTQSGPSAAPVGMLAHAP